MIDYLGRILVILMLCQSAACIGQQSKRIDLSHYDPSSPIKVMVVENDLQLQWQSADNTKFRVDFDLSGTQPLINKISVAKNENSLFEILAEKIHPDFQVTIGTRDASLDVNWPWIFFDNPFSREFKTYPSVIDLNSVKVQSTEGRVMITFSSITSGSFHGYLVCHIYSGSPLIYWEAVMTSDQPRVAYLYDTRFHTKVPKLVYEDYISSNLDRVDPEDTLTNYKVKYRTLMIDYPNGTMAIFPPPHAHFWAANKPSPNIGFLQASKEVIGTRQARNLDIEYNAWVDAPVGKYQRMGVFQLLSPFDAESTLKKIKLYTHGDQFKILDGYKTYTSHYHPRITRYELEGKFAYPKEFKKVMKNLNVQIVHLAEFHCCGDWNGKAKGIERLKQLKGMFDLTQKYSDSEIALLPGEEANVHWGGHWTYIFPKPVYFVKSRELSEPFKEILEDFGTVYHLNKNMDIYEMLKAEGGLAFTAHPRVKGSRDYPDKYAQEPFFLDDEVFAGVEWKAVPSDLSQPRLGQRVFQLQDEMNQWGVKKKMIGAGDMFYLDSTSSIYSQMNISYLKLDSIPDPRNYPEVIDVIKKGDLWLSTGEVLLHSHSITESQVVADVEWTFPLEFAEVIWNEGDKIKRHSISLAETREHGRKQFTFPINLSSATWARFEVWDIARNGAWTQTTWLKEPVKRAIGISGFTLINADTDYPIPGFEPIQDGAIINYQTLPTRKINIRIDPSPYLVDSLQVEFDGDLSLQTDDTYPFSVWGEINGDFKAITPDLGEHTLKVTPYNNGKEGNPLTIKFTLIDEDILHIGKK
jgi:hypothetical protein